MSLTTTPDVDHRSGPVDAPKLVRQRRVHRGWVGLGVLAIVVAALGSVTLFRAIGPAHEYLVVAQEIPVGARVDAEDLRTVRLNTSPGLSAVPANQLADVVGRYAAVSLTPGALLSPDQLTADRVPAPGEQLVAVGLHHDQLPGGDLDAGDPVLLVTTSGRTVGSGERLDNPRTYPARVHRVTDAADDEDVVVSVVVDEGDGAAVAALASAGRIAVVLLPEEAE